MKYAAFRRDAIDELVRDRAFQGAEHAAALRLIHLMRSETQDCDESLGHRIHVKSSEGGLLFLGHESGHRRFLVIDLEACRLNDGTWSLQDSILYLQKCFRLALKRWDQGVLTPAERLVSPRKVVIFPHPLSQKTSVRISLDLSPDAERVSKRGRAGQYILAYRISTDDGGGPLEEAPAANFRRFFDGVFEAESFISAPPKRVTTTENGVPLEAVSLELPPGRIDMHQDYDKWMRIISDEQRRFVDLPVGGPCRLEGPAGTGKTLCLALRALKILKDATEQENEISGLFITHSEASKRYIESVMHAMGASEYLGETGGFQKLIVETLQGYCAELLNRDLSAVELVDVDAHSAKFYQSMYVDEATKTIKQKLSGYAKIMSERMIELFSSDIDEEVVEMVRHEIGVVIKGRCAESFETYKSVPALSTGLPIRTAGDKAFIWAIYQNYADQLSNISLFDTDDVVISAGSHLSTPIWRRRRGREGFDFLMIDETHLFNLNELSIFHHLSKKTDRFPISFAVDRAQAIGDQGWNDDIDVAALVPGAADSDIERTRIASIFRSSAEIINFAFSVTSSGAKLFTNFDHPLAAVSSGISFEEEKLARVPTYREHIDDAEMLEAAFSRADQLRSELDCSRSEIAIVVFTNELFDSAMSMVAERSRPYLSIKRRGDTDTVETAKQRGLFILSMPDYVGGLEFAAVILVGVDKGRVPPASTSGFAESRNFASYASHNRLYVAITRARLRIEVLGVSSRGASSILDGAFADRFIVRNEST
ncbi:UvrD-helicase domain-containing protein [Salinarimonas chemoclinalis]|uniref:UvrD-helicase domain-containing protein n=1 Tax=Salinarimonas chemoclinalis TaxID=3241599 RepID=UPI0035589306